MSSLGHVRPVLLAGSLVTLAAFAGLAVGGCGSSEAKKEVAEPEMTSPTQIGQPTTKDTTPPAPAPTPAHADRDTFAKAVLAALAKTDSDDLFELAVQLEDLRPVLERLKENCPDRLPAGASIDEAIKEFEKNIGTDAERAKQLAQRHLSCSQVSDFLGATLINASFTDPRDDECLGKMADALIIEAKVQDRSVYVFVDDPALIDKGWRMTEGISCSLEHP